ncbi:MAG: hypothetical protein ABIR13_09105, partial [Polaromonas sp.]
TFNDIKTTKLPIPETNPIEEFEPQRPSYQSLQTRQFVSQRYSSMGWTLSLAARRASGPTDSLIGRLR